MRGGARVFGPGSLSELKASLHCVPLQADVIGGRRDHRGMVARVAGISLLLRVTAPGLPGLLPWH